MPFHLPPSFLSRQPFLRHFTLLSITFATWVPVVVFIKDKYYTIASIRGVSMYPYLNSNYNTSTAKDVVLLDVRRPWEDLRRGQLIAFSAPHDPEKIAVKRVLALPGDEVRTRAPYPVAKEIVPSGYVWVEGDVQDMHKSLDSNTYGPISKSLIIGQLRAIVWPWKQRCWLDAKDWAGSNRVREGAHQVEESVVYGE